VRDGKITESPDPKNIGRSLAEVLAEYFNKQEVADAS
jgi:hypothetical protein